MAKRLLGFFSVAALLITNLTACGTSDDLMPLDSIQADQSTQISSLSKTPAKNTVAYSAKVEAFVSNVSKLGVKLTDDQLKIISIQRHVEPSGQFASRPAENLTADQNLDVHFHKHGNEFGVKTKEEYLKRALAFQNRTGSTVSYYFDTTSFDKGYQSNVVKYDSKTHEFGAKKSNGDITTYYTNDTPNPKRFVPVPEDFTY